jgi:hypothetical protein
MRSQAPNGVDRIVDLAFSDNIDLDVGVAGNQTVIAAYATRADRPDFQFWLPRRFADKGWVHELDSDLCHQCRASANCYSRSRAQNS